jgi:hypothetical protein
MGFMGRVLLAAVTNAPPLSLPSSLLALLCLPLPCPAPRVIYLGLPLPHTITYLPCPASTTGDARRGKAFSNANIQGNWQGDLGGHKRNCMIPGEFLNTWPIFCGTRAHTYDVLCHAGLLSQKGPGSGSLSFDQHLSRQTYVLLQFHNLHSISFLSSLPLTIA